MSPEHFILQAVGFYCQLAAVRGFNQGHTQKWLTSDSKISNVLQQRYRYKESNDGELPLKFLLQCSKLRQVLK
jgi:hypothetical protein